MPFLASRDCTLAIQRIVGLRKQNCETPRAGDRSRIGEPGYDINTCNAYMQSLSNTQATIIWGLIPDAAKNNPADANAAVAISLMAQNAGQGTPNACARLLPNGQANAPNIVYCVSPGSPIYIGKDGMTRFISFLYTNMDEGHRVKWYDLTGREQYEWFECWSNHGRGYQRIQETVGLCGTNLNRITTVAALTAATMRSPSLKDCRPAGHPIPAGQWTNVARNLGFGP